MLGDVCACLVRDGHTYMSECQSLMPSHPLLRTQAVFRRSKLQCCLRTSSHTRMFSFLVVAMLCASCLAAPTSPYSYSLAVGAGSGTSFSTAGGNGKITGIRVWEHVNAYITGIQVRNGAIWSPVIGRVRGLAQELILFPGETIAQVSGKYHSSNYIYQIYFGTSRGRFLVAGQPIYISFNFYPVDPKAELKMLSGRFNSAGITSVGAHWDVITHQNQTNSSY